MVIIEYVLILRFANQNPYMKVFSNAIIALLFTSALAFSQDNYHTSLVNQLEINYNLSNPTYPLSSSDEVNRKQMYIYGNATKNEVDISIQSLEKANKINVTQVGANPYDSGLGLKTTKNVLKNDLLLFTFWAKKTSATSNLQIFMEHSTTYEKEIFANISLSDQWTQYFFPAKAGQNYGIDQLAMGIQLANAIQSFELAGFTLLNYGANVALSEVPNFLDPSKYDGSDPNAEWRARAAERIEQIRKSDITFVITDSQGLPLKDAHVEIEMQSHDFGFGSAIVPCRFQGNRCYNPTYVEKINNIDGEGHKFNEIVTENALKWDAWEEEWIGTPDETIAALEYLNDLGIRARGHTLIWPGWDLMPMDMEQNKNNIEYLKNRIFSRIDFMLTHPKLKDIVKEWDVINEITFVRDLENHFRDRPGYTTGRELYKEIFDRAASTSPTHINYINDYATLSGGGANLSATERFKSFLDELFESDAKIDGIGFQSHIGSDLTSINKVENILDEFYDRYKVPIKITEYDVDRNIDDEAAGKYLGDFLTMVFSHPSVEAFIMWGFWDGNHWKSNAPMFDLQWRLKPAGQKFIDLVFKEWWTHESATTNMNGQISFRPFKGQHLVKINVGNSIYKQSIDVIEDQEIMIQVDFTSPTYEVSNERFNVFPNPSHGLITMDFPNEYTSVDISILGINGQLIRKIGKVNDNAQVELGLPSGAYLIEIKLGDEIIIKPLQIIE